jgi:hypothetical protein
MENIWIAEFLADLRAYRRGNLGRNSFHRSFNLPQKNEFICLNIWQIPRKGKLWIQDFVSKIDEESSAWTIDSSEQKLFLWAILQLLWKSLFFRDEHVLMNVSQVGNGSIPPMSEDIDEKHCVFWERLLGIRLN